MVAEDSILQSKETVPQIHFISVEWDSTAN